MSAATDRSPRRGAAVALLLLPALLLTARSGRAQEPAAERSCCHKAPAPDDAALPAGMAALAGDGSAAPPPAASAAPSRGGGAAAAASVALVPASLVDQAGRKVRFPEEVLGDRIVVMDFVFTTCTTICPILSARLARLQERLGDRAGREVRLVSVSIDPARDTPARLEAYAARFGAGAGWTWLTGEIGEVERVLKGLGAFTPAFTDHAPMMLVGDGRTGRFVRLNGFPETERLLAAVDGLLEARGPVATAAGAAR